MAITLVTHTGAASLDGANVTTSSINTTGANFIAAFVAYDGGVSPTPTDSKSNTWTSLTAQTGQFGKGQWFYVANPTVGSGHTASVNVGSSFPAICFISFSGVTITSPFDQQNSGNSLASTSAATGSITPTATNELILAGLTTEAAISSLTIDGTGFTITDSVAGVAGTNYGAYIAYKVQTSIVAENRTWSWTGLNTSAALIASFKETGGGATPTHFLSSLGVG